MLHSINALFAAYPFIPAFCSMVGVVLGGAGLLKWRDTYNKARL